MTGRSGPVVTPADIQYQLDHRYDDNSKAVIVATTVCFVMALISIILRTVARRIQRTGLGWDDFAIWVSMLFATGLWIECLLLAIKYGAGRHSLIVGIAGMGANLKTLFAFQLTYNLAHIAIKASILLLYRKIFTLRNQLFARLWWSVTIFVIINGISNCIILLVQCAPLNYSWEPFLIAGSCVNLNAVAIATGTLIALLDFSLILMPWPLLWSLKMPKRTKMGISALLAFGFLAVICSIVRIIFQISAVWSIDFTVYEVGPIICSVVEVDIGIVCACAPNLRPLFTGGRRRQENSQYQSSRERSGANNSHGRLHNNSAVTGIVFVREKSKELHSFTMSSSDGDDMEK